MDISLLLKFFAALTGILAVLIFFLMYVPKKTAQKKELHKEKKKRVVTDFEKLDTLVKVIKNKKSTSQELQVALDLIIKHHGTIPKKLGIRAHPGFNVYGELIMRICRHPNTNKNLILKFDRELTSRNEAYKKEISDFLTKGLDLRGI